MSRPDRGTYSAWTGAFVISATGDRVAIVGRFDAPAVEQVGGYDVIGYDESVEPALHEHAWAALS